MTRFTSDRSEQGGAPARRALVLAAALAGIAGAIVLTACEGEPRAGLLQGAEPNDAEVGGHAAGGSEPDSTPIVLRRVWGGPDVDLGGASVSADGRYLTFIDWTGTGDVMVREVTTGEVERVTFDGVWEPYQTAEEAAISPDGYRVAYLWYREDASAFNYYELRVIRRGEPSSRLLFRSEECEYPDLWAWTPRGDEVLFLAHMEDGSRRLMAADAEDASIRTLKDFGSADVGPGGLSPDGEHLAYTVVEEGSGKRDISVLELEGGEIAPLVRHPGDDYVLGWSPDGGSVLFASDRSGTLGAWLQPVADGRPVGSPRMVKPDLWRALPIGFADDGRFFFGISLDSRKVYVATVDPESGAVLAAPTAVSGDRIAREDHPTWSPDGNYLAYRSLDDGWAAGAPRRSPRIAIRHMGTGEARDLVPELDVFGNFRWYPDGDRLLVDGRDHEGRGGLFEVDPTTGRTELAKGLEGVVVTRLVDWGPRGRKLFFRTRRRSEESDWSPVTRPVVFDLDTGKETVLYDGDIGYFPGLSPDGRFLAFGTKDGGATVLMVAPTAGGPPRTLVRFEGSDSLKGPEMVRGIAWSLDGGTLLYTRVGNAHAGLWRVSVEGGTPERIDLGLEGGHPGAGFRDLRLHPDGRRIAFDVGESRAEIWVMEEFLPEPEG